MSPLLHEQHLRAGFATLYQHAAIGWDFDDTLIGHAASAAMHAFIMATPTKRHVIITFRTHGLQHRVHADLAAHPTAPPISDFEAVVNIDDAAWSVWNADQARRQRGHLLGALTDAEEHYVTWKASVCMTLGLTVLVDDMTDHVLPGCQQYGIAYVHPDQLRCATNTGR